MTDKKQQDDKPAPKQQPPTDSKAERDRLMEFMRDEMLSTLG